MPDIQSIAVGVFFSLVALLAWLNKRLNDAVAERHPAVFQIVQGKVRPLTRSSRGARRIHHYRMLGDHVVDRHIRNLVRAELLFGTVVVISFLSIFTLLAFVQRG